MHRKILESLSELSIQITTGRSPIVCTLYIQYLLLHSSHSQHEWIPSAESANARERVQQPPAFTALPFRLVSCKCMSGVDEWKRGACVAFDSWVKRQWWCMWVLKKSKRWGPGMMEMLLFFSFALDSRRFRDCVGCEVIDIWRFLLSLYLCCIVSQLGCVDTYRYPMKTWRASGGGAEKASGFNAPKTCRFPCFGFGCHLLEF